MLSNQVIENGAILSFLVKTDHVKNEKPPAFEGQAGRTGGNPLFQLHKMSFHINSNYVFIPLGIGGYLMPFKIKMGSNKKLWVDGKATQSKGITTNYLAH